MIVALCLTVSPQASFALESDNSPSDQAEVDPTLAEAPDRPVGGWSPVELVYIPESSDAPSEPRLKSRLFNAPSSAADSVLTQGISEVGYNGLETDNQRELYDLIDSAETVFMNSGIDLTHDEDGNYIIGKVSFTACGIAHLDDAIEAFYAYDYDHPGYYWISNTLGYTSNNLFLLVDEEYSTGAARARVTEMVSSGVKAYVASAEEGANTLEKIAIVHDKIVNDVDYAQNNSGQPETAKWAHSVHGVFDPEYRQVVCEGYAEAFSLIMNYMRIPNYFITGQAGSGGYGGNGGHAWNAVSTDGGETYLYMDLTWDDEGDDGYSYNYFGMPAADFEKQHFKDIPTASGSSWLYDTPGPYSDSFENTYYNQGGFYYDGSIDAEIFASNAAEKASRNGDFVSILVPDKASLYSVAEAMGNEDIFYSDEPNLPYVTYEGVEYFYYIFRLRDHVHNWGDPKYTWSTDYTKVTASRICLAPHCDVKKESETVYTTSELLEPATCKDGKTKYTAVFGNNAFTAQTKEVSFPTATGHEYVHYKKAAGLLRNGAEYDYCKYCKVKKNVKTLKGYAGYYVKSLKVVTGRKSFTVKWAKQSVANRKKFDGYQIRYSLKSSMAGSKYVKAAKTSKYKKISKLKKNKKYYVQVRTFTIKDGKTYYSKWSAKKKVTTN